MLPLLKNTDMRIHPRCNRYTPVWSAINGPFKRKLDMDTVLSYILGAAIVLAIVTVCFDITIWRP